MADIGSEIELLKTAREDALQLLTADPMLTHERHRHLKVALVAQYGQTLQLAQVG
jgi:hypothetical protein